MSIASRMNVARSLRHLLVAATYLVIALRIAIGDPATLSAQGRYVAIYDDGGRVESDRLQTWSLGLDTALRESLPGLSVTPRCVLDRQNPPQRAGPYLELANGDILPGRIVGYSGDAESCTGQFKVALAGVLQSGKSNTISVRAAAVARIVGAKQALLSQDAPAVLLADGSKLTPRSQRWTSTGLRFLTEQGQRDVPFADLADVVLAGIDRTAATLADSQRAQANDVDRLFRLTTRDGATLTTSFCARYTEREPINRRDRFRPARVPKAFYNLKTSWSPDALVLPEESLCVYGVRPVSEIPVSALTAKTLIERNLLGVTRPWLRDQSVRGGALESGKLVSDLGLGMHSHCEVSFELPPGALEFSAWVGLDRNVGNGGCVECKVFLDGLSDEPAWQVDFLRGGDEPSRVGPIDVRAATRLVLAVDYAHDDRPDGTDPLDIRDEVVWLAPRITVDLTAAGRRSN